MLCRSTQVNVAKFQYFVIGLDNIFRHILKLVPKNIRPTHRPQQFIKILFQDENSFIFDLFQATILLYLFDSSRTV
jgi:hypothetical protein